jgi:hypothetical protein
MLAGLWLWHDALEESHAISQSLATPAGSFWHAIMHRREGDFSNAKYWYARSRNHPVLEEIPHRARPTPSRSPGAPILQRLIEDGWDPDSYVDVVEAIHRKSDDPLYPAAVHFQQIEWQTLFEHCARTAVA